MTVISFEQVSFRYPDSKDVLYNCSLSLADHQIIVLLGANGSGKSTFLKLCLGYLAPTEGEIFINGAPLTGQSARWIGSHFSYAPQSPNFPYQLSVRDYILLGRTPFLKKFEAPSLKDIAVANQVLERLHLSHLSERALQDISGGEQQMASFGRILAQEAPILLLDEITSDLDINNTIEVIQTLTQLKEDHTIILSTHDPQIAASIADILVLFDPNNGIKVGKSDELLKAENLASLYQISADYIQENPLHIRWNLTR